MTSPQQDVAVLGFLHRIPHEQYIHWVREWLRLDEEGNFVGVSLSMLNGDMFDDDDLPVGCRSVLDGHYEITLSYGRNRAIFFCILLILNPDPYAP